MLDEARADHQRRARRPARRRPRHPPAGARRPRADGAIEALALDLAVPGRGRPATLAAGRRRRSSRRSTSRSPSAWPTSAKHAGRRPRLGRARATTTALLRVVVGDDGRGGADPDAGHRDAGGGAAAGGVRRHDEGVEPDRRADPRHPGGAVRLVLAEDHALLRDGLIRLLEAHGFDVVARGRQRRRARPARCATRTSRRRARRTPAADATPTRGCAPRSRSAPRGPGFPVLVLSQYVEQLYARELLASGEGGGRLPAQGPGRRRRASSSTAYAGWPAGGTVLDPEVVAAVMARQRDAAARPAHRPRAGGAGADGRGPVERRHRRRARRHREGRGQAHQQHLHQARPAGRRPTTTAGCWRCSPGYASDRRGLGGRAHSSSRSRGQVLTIRSGSMPAASARSQP